MRTVDQWVEKKEWKTAEMMGCYLVANWVSLKADLRESNWVVRWGHPKVDRMADHLESRMVGRSECSKVAN